MPKLYISWGTRVFIRVSFFNIYSSAVCLSTNLVTDATRLGFVLAHLSIKEICLLNSKNMGVELDSDRLVKLFIY